MVKNRRRKRRTKLRMKRRAGLLLFAAVVLSMPRFVKASERVEKGGYWADKDVFVTEYTIPAVYLGDGKFVDVEGNTVCLEKDRESLNERYKAEKKYILYMSDRGTKDIKDDVVLAVE